MDLNNFVINSYKKNSSSGGKSQGAKSSTASPSSAGKATTTNFVKSTSKTSNPELEATANALKKHGLIKVPVSHTDDNVYRKVAKFLILIGIDQASNVLKHLSTEETEKIVLEISSIRKIENDEALSILEEFNYLIESFKERGGKHTAENILEKAFGKQKAKDLLDRLNIEKEEIPFSYLSNISPEKIKDILKEETNQIRALVLSYVEPKKAADVINSLNDTDKKEVVLHLAKQKQVLPEVIKNIDKVIHEKALKATEVITNKIDGKLILSEILKKMDVKTEHEIISTISDSDPRLAEDLKEKLFTIDDVINCDDRALQQVLREYSDKDLAYLIADKNMRFREKILTNMSKVRSENILEEESLNKPMLKKDVNEITSKFFTYLRHLYERGELAILNSDEEYV